MADATINVVVVIVIVIITVIVIFVVVVVVVVVLGLFFGALEAANGGVLGPLRLRVSFRQQPHTIYCQYQI